MQKGIVKGLVLAAASMLCADAMAVAPGLYMGLMMGPASNTGSAQTIQVQPLPTQANPVANKGEANPKSTQFGSRFYLGYKFNQYAGFEMGFTYFSGISYKTENVLIMPDGSRVQIAETPTPAAGTTGRVRGVDLVGKLDYSYSNTIGIFAKLGVNALYTTTPGALNITNWHQVPASPITYPNGLKTINSGSNTYKVKLAPMFAIGADYGLNQSWVIDATWTRFQAGGALNGMDFYAIGLAYHFVDVYCGQFLCAN